MKHLKTTLTFIAIMALGIGNINAQYVTTHAKTAMPGQQKGIYYALPRTVIQLDFVIEEIEYQEGPYRDYAYLVGASDDVMEEGKEYRIADIRMTSFAEADPNATFFVAMNPRKGDGAEFILTPKGIIQGVGAIGPDPIDAPKELVVSQNIQNREFKYQFGSKGARGLEQMAYGAAEMITKVREEKIKLITGFQETAFTLDTYRQMYADLDEMENDYLSLFVGKKIVNTTVHTVYVIPSKEVTSQSIAKFSKEAGFSKGVTGDGDVITLQAISLKTTGNINELSQSAVESLSHDDKLYYRIPETAYIKVSMNGEILIERRETVAQLGVFMLAPLGKTKLAFDPNTGQITSMGMD